MNPLAGVNKLNHDTIHVQYSAVFQLYFLVRVESWTLRRCRRLACGILQQAALHTEVSLERQRKSMHRMTSDT